ncbi:MAG TPA: ATP-binding protein [Solirubrobacteraceae bacterium]|nr:ATP-binding protein [Solirubrobacteraceae bacterium]
MAPREIELPRDRTCAVRARRWLEATAGSHVPSEALDDAKLVATELVENALIHGAGKIWLRLDIAGDRLRLEVTDEGQGAAIKIREQGPELGGWGLVLVDRLATRWGAFEGTTHVWAELPAGPRPR